MRFYRVRIAFALRSVRVHFGSALSLYRFRIAFVSRPDRFRIAYTYKCVFIVFGSRSLCVRIRVCIAFVSRSYRVRIAIVLHML
jgi:hypothetical protein